MQEHLEKDKDKDKDKPDKTVTVMVVAPRDPDPKEFTWDRDLTVGAAAAEAGGAFGYEPGTPSFVNDKGEVLDRDKTLHQEHVKDRDTLELVDVGGGV
jgi:hypothetical protein